MNPGLAPKPRTHAALILLTVAVAVAGCDPKAGPGAKSGGDDNPLVGTKAPEFDLPAQSGAEKVSLSDAAGKVTIVDFWATWCAPCRESFPAYQQMVDKFGDKLVMIGISVDEDPDGIKGFASETGAKFPLAWDKGQTIAGEYKPATMPTSFIIDKHGVIRFVHAGFHTGEGQEIEQQIEQLEAE